MWRRLYRGANASLEVQQAETLLKKHYREFLWLPQIKTCEPKTFEAPQQADF